jgi:hypothetical protein
MHHGVNCEDLRNLLLMVAWSRLALAFVGWPLIPNVKTDASGDLGDVRFTVDETLQRPRGLGW